MIKMSRKRIIYISVVIVLILFSLALNIGFSAFTNQSGGAFANIKVAGMEYSLHINGSPNSIITGTKNKVTPANVTIFSLNNVDSKYELAFKVCSDSTCNNFVETPSGLKVEYSSKTIDNITGSITKNGSKQIRIIVTNETNTTYYIKLDINAGYIHNTLALKNLINTEHNEEDVIIAAIIDGEISTTFPTIKGIYDTEVTCTTNNGPSNATGTVSWNGSKWVVNITGVDTGRTICNVEFFKFLGKSILAQGGGASAIEAKGNPDFSTVSTSSDTGLYAAEDEYSMSYYYRGNKIELNNNIIWGGFQWKIVRINGDGSVRLIYNGTEAQFNSANKMNDTGLNTQIKNNVKYNVAASDVKYVGYMYGGDPGMPSTVRNGTTWNAATYNQTNSNIRTELDSWYASNIAGKSFEADIVDNLFCNDRQLSSEVGGPETGPGYGGTSLTFYAAKYRLSTYKSPTLKCGLQNDRFTKNDTTKGNGALTYPIGLISADETSMAGLRYPQSNNTNYLNTNQFYWLGSPADFIYVTNPGRATSYAVGSTGSLHEIKVSDNYGLRGAVSINSEVKVTGTGSDVDPYKVV